MRRTVCGAGLGLLLVLFCAVMVLTGGVASAKAAASGVRDDDFAAHGIALGEAVTQEQLTAAFGKLLYDDDVTRWGVPLKRYTFKKDVRVFVVRKTQRVAEIVLEKDAAAGRDGVRYGATSYYLQRIYGKTERVNLDGDACFIYTNPADKYERLICTVAHDDGSLTGLRLTALPLTEDEADTWATEGMLTTDDGRADGETLANVMAGQAQIDTSALPASEPPRLGGLTK